MLRLALTTLHSRDKISHFPSGFHLSSIGDRPKHSQLQKLTTQNTHTTRFIVIYIKSRVSHYFAYALRQKDYRDYVGVIFLHMEREKLLLPNSSVPACESLR